MNAKDKIAKGRTKLILDKPFWGSLALRLEVIEDPSVGTMATDGRSLSYAPAFVDTLSNEEVTAVIAHEVMHCALGHPVRHKGREAQRWNQACDYSVNPILKDDGFRLPGKPLLSDEYRDMSADEIYGRLQSQPEQQGEGSGSGDEDGDSDGSGMGKVVEPKHGDGQALSESEAKQLEQEWKVAMTQAAQAAKAMGQLSGSLQRMVEDFVAPKVNWVEILRRFVDSYARNDYAMFPPNRRYVSLGLYLPSVRSEELGSLAVTMDTSGSVDYETIRQFASELNDIAYHYRTDTTVIHCDHSVQSVEHFPVDTDIELHPKGGGGTDFRPPFRELEERGVLPVCMIYFTDGYCNRFPEDPGYPVLWAIYGRSYGGSFEPPFGEVIEL